MAQSNEKELACYCHWGGERKVVDGRFSYEGGVIDLILVSTKTSYVEFVQDVCDALSIDPTGTTFQYSSKMDFSKLVHLRDDRGMKMMCRFNDEKVDVFVSKDLPETPLPPPTLEKRRPNTEPSRGVSEDAHSTTQLPSQAPHISLVTLPIDVEESGIKEGQIFESPNQFKQAVVWFAMTNKFNFEFLNNSRSYYRIICKVKDCSWKLTAGCEGDSGIVRVKKLHNVHCHTTTDIANYKPTVRAKYVGGMIKDKIAETPGYLPGQIRKDFESSVSIRMSYHQAWSSKKWAKCSISGDPKDSFKFVPWMCERLKECIPGTRANYILSDDDRFKQLFVAYGCSITGFMVACRPILYIDLCHLPAHDQGVVMSASALDANNGLYPLAYSFASIENDDSWLWFLQELKEILGNRVVVLMTEMRPSLLLGIVKTFGGECNSWCLRHLKEIFSKFMLSKGIKNRSRETGLKILEEISYARDEGMFHHYLTMMHNFKPELANWVKENGPEHWANALFPYKRWDWLYTNPSESLNAWIGPLKELNIFQFMKDHVLHLKDFLVEKATMLEKCQTPVGNKIEEKILYNQSRSTGFGYKNSSNGEYIVIDRTMKKYTVKLLSHECGCFEWQMSGIPCPHAMVLLDPARLNVYDMVDHWFKNDLQQQLLQLMIPPVHTHDEPTLDELLSMGSDVTQTRASNVIPLSPITKRARGRPRKKDIESQHQDKRVICCSRCHMPGHNRKKCKEAIPE